MPIILREENKLGYGPNPSYESILQFLQAAINTQDKESVFGALGMLGITGAQQSEALWQKLSNPYAASNIPIGPGAGGAGGGGPSTAVQREAMLGALRTSDWALPFDVRPLISQVVTQKGNMSVLLNRIMNDKRFKATFPGIFRADGTLRMSPGEYRNLKEQYQSIAAQHGFNLNQAQIGQLVAKDVSPDEWKYRAKAAQFVRTNLPLFAAVQQQVNEVNQDRIRRGLKPVPGLRTVQDAINFVTGNADRDLYNLYESGSVLAAARAAGLQVTGARARELAARTPGIEGFEEAEQRYKSVVDAINAAPGELSVYGVTQKDVETVAFGGPDRERIAQRIEQALKQSEAQSRTEVVGEELTLTKGRRPVGITPSEATA